MDQATLTPEQHSTTSPKLVREARIAETVVLVNGLPGCGKTLLAPIVGSFPRVELGRYHYHLEHTCVLHHLGKIADDAATQLLKIQTDLSLYDSMMSRESNFRPSDLSSIWRNTGTWRHLKRLFMDGDAAVIPRIAQEQPILHLVTHLMLGVADPLFKALGPRLRIVEGVRHPLYMVKQWYAWMHRAGVDPRMFGNWIEYKGHSLPWFALGWEERWVASNRMDRTIYSIINQWELAMGTLRRLSPAERKQVLVVPFEQIVINPEPFIRELETLLGAPAGKRTRRMMKKQNVPRKRWAEGIGLKIYKQYGWEKPAEGATERDELAKRRQWVAAEASPQALADWDRHCAAYEAEYLPDLPKNPS